MGKIIASGSAGLIPSILRTIDVTIEQHLAAEIQTANGRALLDMCRSLLFWSTMQLEQHQTLYEERLASMSSLNAETLPAASLEIQPADALIAQPTAAEVRYAECVAATEIHFDSVPWLTRLLAIERRFSGALEPESVQAAETAYYGGRSHGRPSFAEIERKIDAPALTRYLKQKFPEFSGIEASGVVVLAGGMTKQTILFNISGHPELSGPAVLRVDPETSYSDFSVVDEYDLLIRMHKLGLAVPEPLWLETACDALGTPFLVVKKVRGQPAIELDLTDPAILSHFVKRLAESLVKIHAISMEAEAAPLTVPQLVMRQVAELKAFSLRREIVPSVGFKTLFCWLEQNIPQNIGYPPALIHGDYGFHNMMADNGEISAILDWEFSHYGDPAEDVAYCLPFVKRLGAGKMFVEYYEKFGGRKYTQEQLTYFSIWQNVRNAVYAATAGRAFAQARPGNIRLAMCEFSLRPRFELEALDQLLQLARRAEAPSGV